MSGSTQRNVPQPPKWPNVRGELRAPDQCGAFVALDLDAETPVQRAEPAEVRQHAVEAGELDARHLRERLRRNERRRAARARARALLERAVHAGARVPAGRAQARAVRTPPRARSPRTASRRARRGARRVPETPRSSRSAAAPGGAIGVVALERQAGRVRQQVPHGGAGRARGLVEVDDALLRGDEHRERRDGLRDRPAARS